MGGRSSGKFMINRDGHGEFSGFVSLENNGGFSSLRYRFDKSSVVDYKKVILRLKGDGKKYQFRIKASAYDRHSFIAHFKTDGSWQEIEITLRDMYPAFRGRRLTIPNFPGEQMEEIAFLISNKKEESFKLIIDSILLE